MSQGTLAVGPLVAPMVRTLAHSTTQLMWSNTHKSGEQDPATLLEALEYNMLQVKFN